MSNPLCPRRSNALLVAPPRRRASSPASDPLSLVRDRELKELLTARGILVSSFNADLLYEPWEVNDDEGRPFFTFVTFWSKCLSMPYGPPAPLLPPKKIIPGLANVPEKVALCGHN